MSKRADDWADEAAVVIINEVLDLRTKEARETIARQLRAIRKRGEEIGRASFERVRS